MLALLDYEVAPHRADPDVYAIDLNAAAGDAVPPTPSLAPGTR